MRYSLSFSAMSTSQRDTSSPDPMYFSTTQEHHTWSEVHVITTRGTGPASYSHIIELEHGNAPIQLVPPRNPMNAGTSSCNVCTIDSMSHPSTTVTPHMFACGVARKVTPASDPQQRSGYDDTKAVEAATTTAGNDVPRILIAVALKLAVSSDNDAHTPTNSKTNSGTEWHSPSPHNMQRRHANREGTQYATLAFKREANPHSAKTNVDARSLFDMRSTGYDYISQRMETAANGNLLGTEIIRHAYVNISEDEKIKDSSSTTSIKQHAEEEVAEQHAGDSSRKHSEKAQEGSDQIGKFLDVANTICGTFAQSLGQALQGSNCENNRGETLRGKNIGGDSFFWRRKSATRNSPRR